MSPQFPSRWRRESGAVIVHVVTALIALIAFSAITIDYGVMWMSRRQAQNAADAAALAGAISLAFDNPTDWDRARASAETAGEANLIFGAAPDIVRGAGFTTDVTQDISFPDSPSDSCPSGGPVDRCVRANVYRTTAAYTQGGGAANPLPTFFASIFGRSTQGVRATATAQLTAGNATTCLRPWAVADKWQEHVRKQCSQQNQTPPDCNGTWVPNSTWDTSQSFDKWNRGNPPTPNTEITASGNTPDEYRAPGTNGTTDPGTGFGLYESDGVTLKDYGQLIKLKLGSNNDPISSGWFLALDLSGECIAEGCPTNSGAQMYKYAIQNCVGGTVSIGDTLPVETGNMVGPTDQGTYQATGNDPLSIWQRDPNARWNPTTMEIENTCAPGTCADNQAYLISPRIIPVALFNIDAYLAAGYNGNNGSVTITNIMGFFVISQAEAAALGYDTQQGGQNGTVYGIMVSVPGLTTSTSNNTQPFIVTVRLVR
jgi:Flp pilus assembly protein TadG